MACHVMERRGLKSGLGRNSREPFEALAMNTTLKIRGDLLREVRTDLSRSHAFAHERVGFLRAGAATTPRGLLITVRDYRTVDDADYEYDPRLGAKIGSQAMRKAVQSAYRPAAVLLHIHTHGGSGRPNFSPIDLKSAHEFVPGFFETAPRMPHGLLVLSDNSVQGLLWLGSCQQPLTITNFISVAAPLLRDWGNHGMA